VDQGITMNSSTSPRLGVISAYALREYFEALLFSSGLKV
jgi:hypothetical protein